MLYQLSYLGISGEARKTRPLIARNLAVQCFRIGGSCRDAITFAQPLQQVAILAAAAAERLVRGIGGIAAERAAIGLGHDWKEMGTPVRRDNSAIRSGCAASQAATRGPA